MAANVPCDPFMNSNTSVLVLLKRLWFQINRRRRWQFKLLLLLMMLTSLSEVLSIGAALPFLGALTAPEKIFELPILQSTLQYLNITNPNQLLLPISLGFGFAAIIAGVLRLLLLWFSNRLSFATGADISSRIYRHILYKPYSFHIANNTSELINSVSAKSNDVIFLVLNPTLLLISSVLMIAIILLAIFMLQPLLAIATFGGFALIYGCVIILTRKRLLINSETVSNESTKVIKIIQEGLGAIRDILINGSQEVYCNIYLESDGVLRRAQGNNLFIAQSPRYVMEALGMFMIALVAYILALTPNGITDAIPVLGMLALGAQRLLPVLQQAYSSWSLILGRQQSLIDTLNLLDDELPNYSYVSAVKQFNFSSSITLRNLDFRYNLNSPYILRDINLIIPKGSRVGLVGATGVGKSTLVDVILGLLQPTNGIFEIDGVQVTELNKRSWQSQTAHVPQTIFLIDGTIEENIAFGISKEKIDSARVIKVAEQAQIATSIDALPYRYQTMVGERGVRLSGGQRQRIGIARALYKQASVIVFDEATSALDSQTEQAVMDSIDALSTDLTLIIIAHRVTTLKKCTHIVELSGGGLRYFSN